VVLYEEHNNVVVAGITSNTKMGGIPLSIEEGVVKESVIRNNYIFTVSSALILRVIFHLTATKRNMVYDAIVERLGSLR
jgi:hypothetical protein